MGNLSICYHDILWGITQYLKSRELRNTAMCPSIKTEISLEHSRLFFPTTPQVAELPKIYLQERQILIATFAFIKSKVVPLSSTGKQQQLL